jgi:putative transposase
MLSGGRTLATCSDGAPVPALQHYRKYEGTLAIAQRAGNKRRVHAIHAKIVNVRRDQLHKASTKIACENR